MMKRLFSLLMATGLTTWMTTAAPQQQTAVSNLVICHLQTEGQTAPLGLDITRPHFSWQLQSSQKDVMQHSYRILVASHPDTLDNNRGDLWDSQTIVSQQSLWVPYEGDKLQPNQRCFWKVLVTDNHNAQAWSQPTQFGIGLLKEVNWAGSWIGSEYPYPWDVDSMHSRLSARYYRKTFSLQKPVSRATLHIAGLGLYEAFINGQRVGEQVMSPAPTDYRKSIIYNSYDVTDLLCSSATSSTGADLLNNCLAVTVSNGRFYSMRRNYKPHKITNFGFPTLRANLIIEFADGRQQTISTDYKTWRMNADGPIRSANEYDGEIYNANYEQTYEGWTTVDYDDSQWMIAERSARPQGTLVGNLTPSMAIVDTLQVRTLTAKGGNRYILDFGQNFAGWMRLKVEGKGQKGDTIRLRFAERLTESGELYTENLRDAEVTDYYICSGTQTGTWAPRFTTHGFRYAEVYNYPDAHQSDFVGEVVSDPMARTGSFSCAHPMLNQIVQNAYWGILGNYKGMPVDCPQRNERMPWLGDRAIGCWGESYLLDNSTLYYKWLQDIAEAQRADGVIPDVAPAYWNYYSDNVSWPSVFVFAADMLYTQFGDRRAIEQHYAAMRRWLIHFAEDKRDSRTGLIKADKYKDWCVPPEEATMIHSQSPDRVTDGLLIGSAYYYQLLGEVIRYADIILNESDETTLETLSYQGITRERLVADKTQFSLWRDSLRADFNRHFLHIKPGTSPAPQHILYPDSIYYANNTITANLLPLAFGMVPDEYVATIERQILKKILLKPADGHLSCGVIGIQWLMRELSNMGRTDVAYLLATIKTYPSWGYMVEHGATAIWELWNGDTASPKMNSGNHVMLLGDLLPWCFEHLGGIRPKAPGFKQILLAPNFELQELSHCDVSYQCPYGKIVSRWQKTNHHLVWDIEIPCNTTAEVRLPANAITDHGQTTLTLGSGRHHLAIDLDPAKVARRDDEKGAYERSHRTDSISHDRQGILKDEFVYEQAPFPSCHAATIEELPNGDLLCAYFGGQYESAPDVCIWTSRKRRLPDGSMEDGWSAPTLVTDGVLNDTLRKACYNPVLFQIPDGELLLFLKIGRNVRDWTGYIMRSSDNGYTWTPRQEGVLSDSLLGAIKNKPEYIDGKIIAPSSKELGGWRCYMEISEDKGKTWRLVGPIAQDKGVGTIQPTILKHRDGRLQILCRTRKENKRVATSWSHDCGETWSKMELIETLPNNNSGLDAETLPDGRFALVYNPFSLVPGPDKPLRNPLCVATSTDGLNWQHAVTLEDSPVSQYSYPSVIVGTDGTLHIVYTWRRQRIKYIQLKL